MTKMIADILDIAYAVGNEITECAMTLGDAGFLMILALTPFLNPISAMKENKK